MSNIRSAFENKKAFIGFLTAGDPTFEDSIRCINALAEGGADLIEIGIPFSDPIAEGPVIQEANIRALAGGMSTERVFELVREVRKTVSVPIALMTYLNPVYSYGYDAFFAKCAEVGVDGIICPDLPYEESDEVAVPAAKYGIDSVSLIAPTSSDRIRLIAEKARGFLYVVSSMGVTGERSSFSDSLEEMMKEVRASSDIPAAIGFGIHTPEQARMMAQYADGVIVGSGLVKLCEKYGKDAPEHIREYTRSMKTAIS